jgi:N-acetylglucosaminyldiphosphoundecaprenol N-acetyl-beta-D-mannosaminyltransferase
MAAGAAFLFLSGRKTRSDWVGRNGLEWVWRFIQEPKKLWRRDLIDGPQFVWHVLMELAGIRKYK